MVALQSVEAVQRGAAASMWGECLTFDSATGLGGYRLEFARRGGRTGALASSLCAGSNRDGCAPVRRSSAKGAATSMWGESLIFLGARGVRPAVLQFLPAGVRGPGHSIGENRRIAGLTAVITG